MGTKFANLHIRTDHPDAIIKLLEQRFKRTAGEKANDESKISIIDLYVYGDKAALNRLKSQFKAYVAEFNGWVSLLHTGFSWGSVEEFALNLSQELDVPVLAVSYFDDDILSIGVYLKGMLVSQHIKTYGGYDIEDVEVDAESFIRTLDINVTPVELRSALSSENIEEQVDALADLLGFPLWLDSEWIDDSDDEFLMKFREIVK
jgi:hypothetical protein